MITARIEDYPSLKATINTSSEVIFAKIGAPSSLTAAISNPDQILKATIVQKTELESYFETSNDAGGTTIIIGD